MSLSRSAGRPLRVPAFVLLLQVSPPGAVALESRPNAEEPDRPFHVQVDTAVYRVRVTDRDGHLVKGLAAADFLVLEGGDPRPITYFSEEISAPVSLALMIDVGAAMDEPLIRRAKQAVFDLVHILDREDEILIGTFAGEAEFLTELTSDRLQLVRGLENLAPRSTGSRWSLRSAPTEVLHGVAVQIALSGSTSETGGAVDEAILALRPATHPQKAILVFSAGSPGLSVSTLEHLRAARVHFFVAPAGNRLAKLLSLGTTGSLQRKSVVQTGGVQFPLWRITDQIDSIREALKSYYVIGFQPLENELLEERNVDIKIRRGLTHQVSSLPVLEMSGEPRP